MLYEVITNIIFLQSGKTSYHMNQASIGDIKRHLLENAVSCRPTA